RMGVDFVPIFPDPSRCYICPNRGKEVVREWRFQVRAVEVPAGRGASPGPTGNRLASVGDDALRAAPLGPLSRGRKAPLLLQAGDRNRGPRERPSFSFQAATSTTTASAASVFRSKR